MGKSGFHGVENRRIRLPCRGTFPGVPENDDSPCGGRERSPVPAWTSSPNLAASKAPSTSSSASSPPRQRQQHLNPVGARTLPSPLAIAHWNWQHFPIGNIPGPERRPLRETPGAWAARSRKKVQVGFRIGRCGFQPRHPPGRNRMSPPPAKRLVRRGCGQRGQKWFPISGRGGRKYLTVLKLHFLIFKTVNIARPWTCEASVPREIAGYFRAGPRRAEIETRASKKPLPWTDFAKCPS